MTRYAAVAVLLFVIAPLARADVTLMDSDTLIAKRSAALSLKNDLKAKKRPGMPVGRFRADATGSAGLIDAAGVQYFINTDITFSTSSSASGGMSEASYTQSVAVTTLNGGTTQYRLNDAYDGYQTICISMNGSTGPCETGNANYSIYNKNGAPPTATCNGRQLQFPVQTIGNLQVSRLVYVPTDDSFARWINVVTNAGTSAVTFNLMTSNNLGSDNNTVITGTSNGSLTPQTSDTWITSFQNWSGTTSTDPRLGHVMQGVGAPTPVSYLFFENGNDNPYWDYTITLNPGQTKSIMNFGVVAASKTAAAAQAARLVTLPATALECLSTQQEQQIVNFSQSAFLQPVPLVPAPGPRVPALLVLIALCMGGALVGLRVAKTR
jgi:hypothetical protein